MMTLTLLYRIQVLPGRETRRRRRQTEHSVMRESATEPHQRLATTLTETFVTQYHHMCLQYHINTNYILALAFSISI